MKHVSEIINGNQMKLDTLTEGKAKGSSSHPGLVSTGTSFSQAGLTSGLEQLKFYCSLHSLVLY